MLFKELGEQLVGEQSLLVCWTYGMLFVWCGMMCSAYLERLLDSS